MKYLGRGIDRGGVDQGVDCDSFRDAFGTLGA
jgi:hypothetical protein